MWRIARARLLRLRRRRLRSRQQDDGRCILTRRELSAERETVEPWELNVEQHDSGAPEPGDLACVFGRRHFLDLELVSGERHAEQQAQTGIVVHDEDPAAAAGPKISVELRRLHQG